MRAREVRIENFRGIKKLTVSCSDITTIIGANNSGKSTILRALDLFFNTKGALEEGDLPSDMVNSKKDFFSKVEVEFDRLTDREKNTFKKYIIQGDRIRVAKILSLDKKETIYYGYITKGGGDEIELESTPFLGQRNVASGVLPSFYLLPAITNVQDETKIKSTALVGKLVRRILDDAAKKAEDVSDSIRDKLQKVLDIAQSQIKDLEHKIDKELKGWGVKSKFSAESPDISKLMESSFSVTLDDGVATPVEGKGHGLQRAFIFALLSVFAKEKRRSSIEESSEGRGRSARAASNSIIIAIEEPELYLHPQAQRRLLSNLESIAGREDLQDEEVQFFITTHSPYFINPEHYERIVILRRDQNIVNASQVSEGGGLENIKNKKGAWGLAKWIDESVSEMFFAKKVVLVEGETERVCIPYIAERLGYDIHDVTVVECGSKSSIPIYVEILNEFKINYAVVYDEDDTSQDHVKKENERIERSVNSELGKAFCFKRTFMDECGYGEEGKKNKPKKALEYFINMFNSGTEVPQKLKELIEYAYK